MQSQSIWQSATLGWARELGRDDGRPARRHGRRVARYDRLAVEAEPDDRAVLTLFAEHERALYAYAELDPADHAGQRRVLDGIEGVIARAEALEPA